MIEDNDPARLVSDGVLAIALAGQRLGSLSQAGLWGSFFLLLAVERRPDDASVEEAARSGLHVQNPSLPGPSKRISTSASTWRAGMTRRVRLLAAFLGTLSFSGPWMTLLCMEPFLSSLAKTCLFRVLKDG